MIALPWISITLLACCVLAAAYDDDLLSVTCASAVKLKHQPSGFRLHSHGIKWGSGSGQQSVTAFEGRGDANSLWLVKEGFGSDVCPQGTVIKCGDTIRLQHLQTKRYLHSHLHTAPLSGRQEVSGFGEGGPGDTGDNWRVECKTTTWMRDSPVRIVHVDTGKALYTTKSDKFTNQNCHGCPIVGQLEVSAHYSAVTDSNSFWSTEHGLYFPDRHYTGTKKREQTGDHDEDDEHAHEHSEL